MWAKIITIKITMDLNYFSLCALNVFNTRVSQFELNYWNKWTFPQHSNLLRRACIRRIKILRVTFNFQQPKFQQNVYCIQNRAILLCSVCLVRMRAAALVRSRKPRPLLTASKLDIFAWLSLTFTDQKYTCDVSDMHWWKRNVSNALNSTNIRCLPWWIDLIRDRH